jgi:Ubiquinol-cytochrome C chaperone
LKAALARNLYGTASPTETQLEAIARYARREVARLERQPAGDLLMGQVVFGPAALAPGADEPAERR